MSSPEAEQVVPSPVPGPDGRVSRRALIGGGLLVLGAVGGGVAGFVATDPPREVVPDPVAPADVLAAIAREQDLLTAYDAALAAGADPLWTHLRGEHAAHAAALTALLPTGTTAPASGTTSGSPTGSTTSTGPSGPPPDTARLRVAEQTAGEAAQAACLAGNGTAAVLLACIAASELSHAAVLA